MKQKSSYRMGVGVSSLLLVLVVISMTTLSVLALLSASSDVKLSEKRQAYVLALAEADNRLEQVLFELSEGTSPQELQTQAISFSNDSEQLWTIAIPFYDNMLLSAQVEILPEGIKQKLYEISNIGDWEPDDSWEFPY